MWQPQGIYNEYVLRSPVLLVGNEAARGLYNYPATRIAVIHGSSFRDQYLLKSIFKKKEVHFLSRSWRHEPRISEVSDTLKNLEEFIPDTIIAIGGGSVIDGAKLCRLFYEIPYYVPGKTKLDGNLLKTKFISIPTTVGSGAEVSSAAVYVENHRKEMVVLHELQPDVIVYDKRYIMDTPKRLLYASAMDALSHILEGYVSRIHNSLIEVRAEEGLQLLSSELQKMLDGEEPDYQRLQYAGYLGGIVQNHCIVGAGHAVAHQLTEYGYSHGEAVALLLPAVIKMNSKDEDAYKKYKAIAKIAGFYDVEAMVVFIEKINDISGINTRKKELQELLQSKAEDNDFMCNIKSDRGGKGNPLDITDGYIRTLIRSI